jgi:pilus assembly protein Flp/PilA
LLRIFTKRVTVPCKRIRKFTRVRHAHSGQAFCTRGDFGKGKDQVVRKQLWNFCANDEAAAAIEYGLLAAGIAVAIIAVIAALGTNLNSTFSSVSVAIK